MSATTIRALVELPEPVALDDMTLCVKQQVRSVSQVPNAARGGPSHGRGLHAAEIWTCSF